MLLQFPSYSVAIRTLGRAGKLYQNLLESLIIRTIKPEKILVYIAEGYPLPKETVGFEEYVYVSKTYSYNALPSKDILPIDSFAGPAFLVHTDTLRNISFKDEIWMDEFGYG